jgi:hypothetical protein
MSAHRLGRRHAVVAHVGGVNLGGILSSSDTLVWVGHIIVKVLRQSLDRAVTKGWLADNPARKIELLREEKPEIEPLSLETTKGLRVTP